MSDEPSSNVFDRLEQLLEFPVDFPLKIMGRRVDEFSQTIAALITEHAPDFDPATIEFRASRQGTYLSLTAVVPIQSREQLERLYHALAEHPLVKVVL
ncbi:MAG: YbeD family protein [Burkholderiaceae bacterium]